jgi:hypothetical protein
VKQNDPDVIIAEVSTKTVLAEEQAKLLVCVFGRLTSVVFDVNAIIELLSKDDQSNKEILAHVLACSLAYIKTQTL